MIFSRANTSVASIILVAAAPALAGEEPLYMPAPEWAEPSEVNAETRGGTSPIVLLGQQARISTGKLTTYSEFVVALDSPEALNQFGTMQASWLPDKGDLIIHEAVLLRDGKAVNLLEGGKKFEVLRRERRLESRMLDGQLTATMPVAGAQLGDLLRLTYSVTLSDQAMGDHVQWQAGIFTKPFPLGDGYLSVSWPKDMPISTAIMGGVALNPPVAKGNHMEWRVQMPLPQQGDKPGNAPSRYLASPAMQATTYTDWQAVSRSMAPHYNVTNTIKPGSALADEVARIRAASSKPIDRLALSLETVQEQVSYLLNGLNGGNYLPQMPEETWEKRFGDCKAKSVLLLSILRELDIEAEVVLVRSRGGDVLPETAPMPGNFDHMIVRAEVDGETFWLDGTGTGVRKDTMYEVPRFFYALPVRAEGAGLVEMVERPLVSPDRAVQLTIDNRAGIKVPALFDLKAEYRGAMGSRWRAVAEQTDLDQQEGAVDNAVSSLIGAARVTDYTVTYDVEQGLGTVMAKGLMGNAFKRDRVIYEMIAPTQPARNVAYSANRARPEWRDVPLRLNGPNYFTSDLEILLPKEDSDFSVKGRLNVDEVIGGVEVKSKGVLEKGRFVLTQSTRSLQRELPAGEIAGAKRAINRLKLALPKIQSGREFRREWDYMGDGAKALGPVNAAYSKVLADADDEDDMVSALNYRSEFRRKIFDFDGALEDTNAAIGLKRSTNLLWTRAGLLHELGDLKGALADYQEIESLDPTGRTYSDQIELLALLGRADEGLALAEDYRGLGRNEMLEDIVISAAMGWAGKPDEGLQLLEDRRALRPGDGRLLNAICWHAGVWNLVGAKELDTCTQAVERASYSPNVLDSRALANFRMGNLEQAEADLDAALLLEPGLSESRLLRGIVRLAQGDKKGREDVDLALSIEPSLEASYKRWGLDF